jgi:hypothetical protein
MMLLYYTRNAISLILIILTFSHCKLPRLSESILQDITFFQYFTNRNANYSVRVQVSNLIGTGLELSNDGENLPIPSNGKYSFTKKFKSSQTYNVSVSNQPTNPLQNCIVTGGTGTIIQGDINTIQVDCGNALSPISGTTTGLLGTGLQLSYTGPAGTNIHAINGTSFAFPGQEPNSSYTIALTSQPTNPWQTCSITSPGALTGTVPTVGLTIAVNCVTDSNPLSVQVIGIGALGTLGAGQELQVQVNGGETLSFTGDTTLSFPTSLLSGSAYSVAILNAGGNVLTGNCTIPSPTGNIGGPSNTVAVNCTSGFLFSGTVSIPGGSPSSILGSGTQIRITNTGGTAFPTQDITLAAGQTTFSFPTTIPGGGQFAISILTQPTVPAQTCTFTAGTTSGTAASNISDLILNCNLPSASFSLASGTYNNDQSIALSQSLVGSVILYNLGNGAQIDPDCLSTTYVANIPITDNASNTIKAIVCNGGWTPSVVSNSGAYQLQVDSPTPSIASASSLNSGTTVNFSTTTTSAWFCYQDANSPTAPADPSCGVAVSTCNVGTSGNYTFPGIQSKNLKVVGCKLNYNTSSVVSLNYIPQTYTISGTISGLTTPFTASSFVLRNNGADDTIVSANGAYSFSTAISSGENYSVSIFSSPTAPWQTCVLSNPSGTVSNANITNVDLSCSVNSYTMSGTVTSSVALPNGLSISNGVDTVNVASGAVSTPISFATSILSGNPYNITITAEPPGQVCAITSSYSGTMAGANISNVGVNCISGYRSTNGIAKNKPAPLNLHQYRGNSTNIAGNFSTAALQDGIGGAVRFNSIAGLAFDGTKGFIADTGNHAIRWIDPPSQTVTTLVGNGIAGLVNGTGAISAFNSPRGIATDGTYLYISESLGNRIKRTLISSGYTETLAGDTSVVSPANANVDSTNPTLARFATPRGLYLDGEKLYIADRFNHSIRILNIRTLEVTTLTSGAPLNEPEGLTIVGDYIYTCNIAGKTIVRTHKTTGVTDIFAGTNGTAGYRDAIGTNAFFNDPHGITNDGNYLYVGDYSNHKIRRVHITTKKVTTLAGSGLTGSSVGVGIATNIENPMYLLNSGNGLVFGSNHQLRNLNDNFLNAYYPLNDSNSNLSGNDNLITTGSPVATNGRYNEPNGAMSFVSLSYLSYPSVLSPTTTNVTMAVWVKWDGTNTGNEQQIFAVGSNDGYSLTLRNAHNNKLTILEQGAAWGNTCEFTLPTNLWTHVTASSDIAGRWKMYINGKHICTDTLAAPNLPSGNISIGGKPTVDQYFSGSIADARLYTRVLNDGEIQELAQDADSSLVGPSFSTAGTGLMAHYTMDGAGSLNDLGPHGMSLTNFNVTVPIAGKDGNPAGGFRFNGTNDQLAATINTDRGLPMGTSPRTMCAWISPEDYPATTSYGVVFLYGHPGIANNASTISLHTDAGGTKYLAFITTSSDAILPFTVPLNTWSHYCTTYNGGTAIDFYINGKLVGTSNLPTPLATSPNGLRVGNWHNNGANGGNQFFKGKIDDVRIYNNALSALAIRQLATQVPMGLIRRYDFNGDVVDVSGFGQDGTILGTVTAESDRNGIANSAYSFPHISGNYIRASDTGLPMGTSPRTMCAWYKGISTAFSVPFSYGNDGVGTGVSALWLENETLIRFWGNGADLNATVNLPYYVWNHVCLTFNGTQSQVYSNGRLVAGPAAHGLNTVSGAGNFLSLGSWLNTREYSGLLDEVRIYNRVLNNSEILALSGYHPMQVAGWNPTPGISNLKFHYQADTLGAQANGSPVTDWNDSSGNANHLTTGNNITFASNGINSKPSVTLNGSNSHMAKVTPMGVGNLSRFSLFTVANPSAFSGSYDILVDLYNPVSCPGALAYPNFFLNTNYYGGGYCASNNSWNTGNPLTIGNNYIFSTAWDKVTNDPDFGVKYVIFVNGIQNGGFNYISNTPASTQLNLGDSSLANSFRGSIAEILFFSDSLNLNNSGYGILWKEKDIMECYLSSKYNIPTNHSCP